MLSFLGQLHNDRLLPMPSWVLCFSMSDQIHGVVIVTRMGVMFILFREMVFRQIRKKFLLLRALNKAEIASNINDFSFTDEILYTVW